ncbi:hypothetical protein BgAZ_105560 [Babesia gibsoni]|uniref:ABC transporter family protein n=1 Tax=Babesia gibsoni TaxID=33632 RepID=A0AAD8PGA6_BABGI|nr:hypothetical protein BgAZ_105560 [Babesia gibsoni]
MKNPDYVQEDIHERWSYHKIIDYFTDTKRAPWPTKTYDSNGVFNFLFISWAKNWIDYINTNYISFNYLHRMPKADDYYYWQPIFSKHVSDRLLQIESSDYITESGEYDDARIKRFPNILIRAIILTFWRRLLVTLLAILIMSGTTIGSLTLVTRLIKLLSKENQNLGNVTGFIFGIAVVEFVDIFMAQHMSLYINRLHPLIQGCMTLTLFEHGRVHRKDFQNMMKKKGVVNGCKGIVHSWPSQKNECTQNPLKCPARRHQNEELSTKMYTFLFVDTGGVTGLVRIFIYSVHFVSKLSMAFVAMKTENLANVFKPLMVVMVALFMSILIELFTWFALTHTLRAKDNRVSKSLDLVGKLELLTSMGQEDIAFNTIKDYREDELTLIRVRQSLLYLSKIILKGLGPMVYLIVVWDYLKEIATADSPANFTVAGPIAIIHIAKTLQQSMQNFLFILKFTVSALVSNKRLEEFLLKTSPNFYFRKHESEILNDENATKEDDPIDQGLDSSTLVHLKQASFNWICDRKSLFEAKEEGMSMLDKIDFELKRGEVRIVTGPQGCGKTSFIKSILGEMSLVSGSMAVAPLSTGMPIFYTSQEVWLPTDSIRAIITFGYAFDEEIYNEVVRCAELLRDFSSWDDGDMRVISEKGYSLSGGQRVRVSLARALYAYMVFSKANESLENNRCCFLMCLDEPFNGLDVNVATAIFNNLFNKETGLLVRDDVAIVMAMSKMNLNVCLTNADYLSLVRLYWHNMEDGRFSSVSVLPEVTSNDMGEVADGEKEWNIISNTSISHNSLSVIEVPIGNEFENVNLIATSPSNVDEVSDYLRSVAEKDVGEQNRLCDTSYAYIRYLQSVGWGHVVGIMICLTLAISMNEIRSIRVARWSEFMNKTPNLAKEGILDMIKFGQTNDAYGVEVNALTFSFIGMTLFGMLWVANVAIMASRRIHTFVMNSLFNKDSTILEIKKSLALVMTFLSSDIYYIDETTARLMMENTYTFETLCFQFFTMCYSAPLITPIYIATVFLLYFFVVRRFLISNKKVQFAVLEGNASLNIVYGDVIAGSNIYRSFALEDLSMQRIMNVSEKYYGTLFLKTSNATWATLMCRCTVNVTLLVVGLIQVTISYVQKEDMSMAWISLGLTSTMALNTAFNNLIAEFTVLETFICSTARYNQYFLQGKFSLKEKFESMDETILSGYGSTKEREKEDKRRLSDLIKRRKREFRNFAFRRYRSVMNTLFYKPKIKVLDIASYLPADHTSLTLDKVFVPQPAHNTAETSRYILKNVSASTQVGDVIGIVGRTGAGKSTLLGVLQNITRNREGSVLLDGRELSTIPRSVLRHIIGVLPQIPFVFQGWTLRRFLDPRMLYSDEAILNALECCGMLDTVMSLPGGKGLDAVLVPQELPSIGGLYLLTPIIKLKSAKVDTTLVKRESADVENSSSVSTMLFSMGQLRLLSFARLVLYRETYRILLVDEPPSDNAHGDEEGNKDSAEDLTDLSLPIYDLVKIYFKHCTTFIVAHDKDVMKSCNKVWILSNGMLIEQCTMDEFLIKGFKSAQ